ncbi:MAG: hypothetical protein ACLQVY_01785 [Limisphaerales bacterium]
MEASKVLAIASGVAYTVAYLDYNRQVVKGATRPNGATWLIWSVIAGVSTTSYLKASGDVWKSVIPIINICLCLATFVLAVSLKKFKQPDPMDFIALLIGAIAVVVWKQYGSAKYANLIVQFAILSGFIPTWRAIRADPWCEQPRPWWLWTTGYFLAGVVVLLRWNGQWFDLVYPVNCALLHSSVPLVGEAKRPAC